MTVARVSAHLTTFCRPDTVRAMPRADGTLSPRVAFDSDASWTSSREAFFCGDSNVRPSISLFFPSL
jgi:hypothetical protein